MIVTERNVPSAFYKMGAYMYEHGVSEPSRNGEVVTVPHPVMLEIKKPMERVLTDPKRDANPFFHIAETVWMLGGGQGIEFITWYNKGMNRYSDDGATMNGAYGHRWRNHFYHDQILGAIQLLTEDPTTRRAVLAMWDAEIDLASPSLDIPCNTHIYFRVSGGQLDMTVSNRSNDVVWGMLGANSVHMTYLHEVIAAAIGRPMGAYRVFTVNAHTYVANPQTVALLHSTEHHDIYQSKGVRPLPVATMPHEAMKLLSACKTAIAMPWQDSYNSDWLNMVYVPMRNAWRKRKAGKDYREDIAQINAHDWRIACTEWCARRVEDD
tara:strand:+ start:412 stop:1380 length:969 start_codon:yes stop_codon:yes gene_type:complete